jgi:acylphosphatase
MKVRATFTVKGKVQDVGLRDKIKRKADPLGIAGQAENLDNGSVKVICESDKESILELRRRMTSENGLSQVRPGRIRYSKPQGAFRGFRIIREPDYPQATYRKLDKGVRHLGNINLRLGRIESGINGLNFGIKSVKSGIKGLRSDNRSIRSGINGVRSGVRGLKSGVKQVHSGIKGVHSGIRAMDSHMGGHFRRLDKKYDRFGDTMAQVARDLHGIRGDLRRAVSGRER